jgi:hypothetical protein
MIQKLWKKLWRRVHARARGMARGAPDSAGIATPAPRASRPQPGDCVAVCGACGQRVEVPPIAGQGPWLKHVEGCPRTDWAVVDATLYTDGEQATIDNWHQG